MDGSATDLVASYPLPWLQALAEAQAVDNQASKGNDVGPLCGLPLAVKDSIDVDDYPTSAGTPALLGTVMLLARMGFWPRSAFHMFTAQMQQSLLLEHWVPSSSSCLSTRTLNTRRVLMETPSKVVKWSDGMLLRAGTRAAG